MTLDPAFRLYRSDPQRRALPTLGELHRFAVVEREALASIASSLIAKGRLTRGDANDRERIWANIAARFAYPDAAARSTAAGLAAATWRETVAELRRLIVLRRDALDRRAGDDDTAELQLALDRVEALHDMVWTHTATPEAEAARRQPDAPGLPLDRRHAAA